MDDKQTIVGLVNLWAELLERVAEATCECRCPGDREPLDLERHSDECPYPRIVRGQRVS